MGRQVIKYIAIYLGLILGYCVFAVISCSLPDQAIKRRIEKVAEPLAEKGNYPNDIIDLTPCREDNFMHALILNQIYCIDRSHPFLAAMRADRVGRSMEQPAELLKLTRNEYTDPPTSYARYWHGSTFLYRIFLFFTNYHTLQLILFITSSLLWLIFCLTYYPKAGLWKTIALFMSWLLVYGFVQMFSLQFFPVLAITLLTSILITKHSENRRYISLLFFITSSLTCFFDLLTTPLLSLGWPLVVWLSIQNDTKNTLKDRIVPLVSWSALWSLGFSLTWFSKWVIGTVTLKRSVLDDAFKTAIYRTSAEYFNRFEVITQNTNMLPYALIICTLIIFLIVAATHFNKNGFRRSWLFIILAILPYLWYLLLANHSYKHFWFTYRLQAITIAALGMFLLCFKKDKSRKGLANSVGNQ